jgi:hypothetical protein
MIDSPQEAVDSAVTPGAGPVEMKNCHVADRPEEREPVPGMAEIWVRSAVAD